MKAVDENRYLIRNSRPGRPRFVSDADRRRGDEGRTGARGGEKQTRAAVDFRGPAGAAKKPRTPKLSHRASPADRTGPDGPTVRFAGWRRRLFDVPGAAAARGAGTVEHPTGRRHDDHRARDVRDRAEVLAVA